MENTKTAQYVTEDSLPQIAGTFANKKPRTDKIIYLNANLYEIYNAKTVPLLGETLNIDAKKKNSGTRNKIKMIKIL